MSSEAHIRLKPRQEGRLRAGHCWVFSNEIAEVSGSPGPGDLVKASSASGEPLGVGFYNPKSLIAWRRCSREDEPIDAAFFGRRLAEAKALRERRYPGETSYRLCFGESDGLPGLVVDRYGDYLVVQVLSAGVDVRLDSVREALEGLLAPRGIYLKNDHRLRHLEGLKAECRVLGGEVPERVEAVEAGLKFSAALGQGQKTGFYFDQRDNRGFLRPYFKDRVVWDLYCYTGAFSINAAKFGAAKVFGLDSSEPAVALARENARLNDLDIRFGSGDAMEALAGAPAFVGSAESGSAESAQDSPDMILLDPPSFAPSKKDLSKACRSYVKLNAMALGRLSSGGLLATSTCSHHVSREIFVEILRQAQAKARRPARLLALRGQALDHPVLLAMPETEYLHFGLLEVV